MYVTTKAIAMMQDHLHMDNVNLGNQEGHHQYCDAILAMVLVNFS